MGLVMIEIILKIQIISLIPSPHSEAEEEGEEWNDAKTEITEPHAFRHFLIHSPLSLFSHLHYVTAR